EAPFLESTTIAMAEAASAAGLTARRFQALLGSIALDPEGAFAGLRALLWDAMIALVRCPNAGDAHAALSRFDQHKFGPLLHHYELSNWVLHARAYAKINAAPDRRACRIDAELREAPDPLSWLRAWWIAPALTRPLDSA
ncbi:MAG: hypothetical protein ACREJ3_08805, partial [Polyangiaceae bacterium]